MRKKKLKPRKRWWDIFRFTPLPKEAEKSIKAELPTWEEFSDTVNKKEEEATFDIPKHELHLESPLGKNLFVFFIATFLLLFSWQYPTYNQEVIYSLIFSIFGLGIFLALRDSFFFHLETNRLHKDAAYINKNMAGKTPEPKSVGLIDKIFKKKVNEKKIDFRSQFFRIHFANILRTFEQGNRKSWVEQTHSLTEIHTMISQGGMKVVWTIIEILPQIGLIGTLAGLIQMLNSFSGSTGGMNPTMMSGFALALGTTILANILVLILRPLYMMNERTMLQTLASLEGLMATFILPTQQQVLEDQNSNRSLKKSIDGLNEALKKSQELLHTKAPMTQPVQGGSIAPMQREISALCNQIEVFMRETHQPKEQELVLLEEIIHQLQGISFETTEKQGIENEKLSVGQQQVDLLAEISNQVGNINTDISHQQKEEKIPFAPPLKVPKPPTSNYYALVPKKEKDKVLK